MKPLLPLLAAVLLLTACEEPTREPTFDETLREQFNRAMQELENKAESTPRAKGDVNAVDSHGQTELAEVSEHLYRALDWQKDAIRDEDPESAAAYAEEAAELKARIRELLRAGADPWARGLTQRDGKLGTCARPYWPQDFVDELRAEGFNISDTPAP